MIGVDTNVLVRYLTQDEPRQAATATRFFEHDLTEAEPGFLGLVVLVETVWVLHRLYRATSEEVVAMVRDLLSSRAIVVERRDVVIDAVSSAAQSGAGFSDALIAASARYEGCSRVMTFDRAAVRAGMTLLK